MNHATKTTAIESSKLAQLIAASPRTLFTSCLLGIVLVYLQHGSIAPQVLYTWLALIISINLVRITFTYYVKRNPSNELATLQTRLRQFRYGLMASGLVWGVGSLFLILPADLTHQMMVIFILTGLSAGGVASYSVDVKSAIPYTALTIVPIVIYLFFMNTNLSIIMAFTGGLYLSFLVVSILHLNQTLIENFNLRFDAIAREEAIQHLAFYDVLTKLPNRRLLLDRLDHALAMGERTTRRGAFLFLDLDNFKILNDTQGHEIGDLLLQQVAIRLLSCVRESDTVARLGGDEFVIMLEDLNDGLSAATQQAENTANKIAAALNRPYQLNHLMHYSTPSIGIAIFPDHGTTHTELLKHADIAMYQAKKAGRNAVRTFKPDH
ncbi:MAG: GGDEF domain-containing protein [Methylotenera sp.]|nr:GGDEF domain-containing protein [Methylotenera sp.]